MPLKIYDSHSMKGTKLVNQGALLVTPISLEQNGMHNLMCAQRSITHKLTN
jgi:hypothetical protein